MSQQAIIMTPSELDQFKFELKEHVSQELGKLKALVVEKPMKTKEAAAFLTITPEALLKRVHADKNFPCFKVGGCGYYFYPSKLNEYIMKHKR